MRQVTKSQTGILACRHFYSLLGTTENSLVTCEVLVTCKKVVHVMPALGPLDKLASLTDCPPETEQVTLCALSRVPLGI